MASVRTVIYEAETAVEAERLKERLEQEGISATVDVPSAEREASQRWALPVHVPVAVDASQAEAARRIVETFDGQTHRHPLKVIYEARTVPEAQRLKERLAEAGIAAVVSTEVAEGEAATDVWGLPVPARVAVAEEQAEAARRIALDFDAEIIDRVEREAERPASRNEASEEAQTEPAEAVTTVLAGPAVWPHCPECRAPRVTRCPVCHTLGTEFRRAEMAEVAQPVPDLVVCPECDEPFEPVYARHCKQCGHEFADGYSEAGGPPREKLTSRIILSLLGIIAVLGGLLIYFANLVYQHGR